MGNRQAALPPGLAYRGLLAAHIRTMLTTDSIRLREQPRSDTRAAQRRGTYTNSVDHSSMEEHSAVRLVSLETVLPRSC